MSPTNPIVSIQQIAHTTTADARQQRIGRSNKDNVHQALRTLSLYPFTMLLGMNIEEFNDLIVRAREEAVDPRLKAYFPL